MNNYAGPGAIVGIQGGSIVVSGGVSVGKDAVVLGDVIIGDEADDEDN